MILTTMATRDEAETLVDDLISYANAIMNTYYAITVGDLIDEVDLLLATKHNKNYALYKQGWKYGCVFKHNIEIVKNDRFYSIVVSNYKELQ